MKKSQFKITKSSNELSAQWVIYERKDKVLLLNPIHDDEQWEALRDSYCAKVYFETREAALIFLKNLLTKEAEQEKKKEEERKKNEIPFFYHYFNEIGGEYTP
jgi:hypothetical protein